MSASSSYSFVPPRQLKYDVFLSFSGQDVRQNFLSHLLAEFKRKGINTFVDDQIRRSEFIGPELKRAIRASRIAIVILTKNYASSSWCLDELSEIMECRKTSGQVVMTIFYDMDPSDVREQRGDFGQAFERSCEGKTEDQKQSWKQALTDVANIADEHLHNWDSEGEAAMMLKIATDIIIAIEGLNCLPIPRKLKLLRWEACPMKHMSFRIRPECLIEINMKWSKLKKLWDGVPKLRSLKKMDLSDSTSLEELPDLSEAEFLNHLNIRGCHSLLKLPPSIWKLDWLKSLDLYACKNLEPFPANISLLSLSKLDISECSKLVNFPEISTYIEHLNVSFTKISAVPPSIKDWDCLHELKMIGCGNVTEFPRLSYTVSKLHLHLTGIKEVPSWISDLYGLKELSMAFCTELQEISPKICELGKLQSLNFKGCYNVREFPAEIFQSFCIWHELSLTLINIGENSLPTYTPGKTYDFPLRLYLCENDFVSIPDSVVQQVQYLYLRDCRELVSLPELPDSLSELYADNCVSLERLSQSSRSPHDPKLILNFINCSKLDEEARKLVIEQWACGYAVLPGSEVPYYFTHKAKGSSLTIHLNQFLIGSMSFKACVVLPPGDERDVVPFCSFQISCYVSGRHSTTVYKWPEIYVDESKGQLLENHLFILNSYFKLEGHNIPESEMVFDFRCLGMKVNRDTISSNILGCGVQKLEPCSCKYDSEAHPRLSTIPLKDDEGNNKSNAETGRSNKRERSSVAGGLERTSKNLRISDESQSVEAADVEE